MMRCVIIDDEPNAVELLKRYADRIDFLSTIGTFRDPSKALQVLNSDEVDVVFVDINMPGLTGMQLLQSLQKQPLVIFTTAYPEYAVASYDFNTVDYLVKPISFERFLKAVNKADVMHKMMQFKTASSAKRSVSPDATIILKSGTHLHIVPKDDVLYFEKDGNYVTVHTNKQKILVRGSIADVFHWVNEEAYLQVHKSFVVSLAKIEMIELHQVTVRGRKIPVGGVYRDALMARVNRDAGE